VGSAVVYATNTRTDIGTQVATATISGSNFTTVVLTADLTITQATVTGITFADASFVFDGTAKSIAITGTLPAGTSVAYTNNSRTDIGTQEVAATISGSNFTTLVLTADLTILPVALAGITFVDESFVFDGTVKTIEISGTLPVGSAVVYATNTRTDIGTQVATATISGSNFTTVVLTADLTITQATVTGVTLADASFVFDGTAKSLAITGKLPTGTSVAYANNSRTNVGTQEVTATITGANFTTVSLTADLTITEGTVSGITFVDQSFIFDGTAKSLAITGTLPTGTSVAYANNSITNIGTRLVTATISGANFTTLVLTADLEITPATVTGITFIDASFVFDGTAKSIAITGTLPNGTSVAYSNNSRTNIGSLEVTAAISGVNFITLILTADLTISPATVTGITFADASFVFDGTAKSLVITGALPTGTSVAYANNSRANSGTHVVTATISGANFTTLVLIAELEINPADLLIAADANQSKLFGQADPELIFTASGFVGWDNKTLLTGALSRVAGEQVGIYAINQGSLDAGMNYTISFIGVDFEIISNDTDGDGVPDDVENVQGTDPKDPNDFRDSDADEVPDYVEEQDGTDPNDATDVADSDKDGVPDYVEAQQSTDPNNSNEFKDSDGDGIPNYVQDRSILEFVAQMVFVAWGTPVEGLGLATEVVGVTGKGEFINLGVTWDLLGYNPLLPSTKNYFGTAILPKGILNTYRIRPIFTIRIAAKSAPLDVLLSNLEFGASISTNTEIGTFSTVDPQDNIHSYELVNALLNDGKYFRIEGNLLYWNTDESLPGQTSFTITVRSTDRAGNIIERNFVLSRIRIPLAQVNIVNSFSPNNDGINDTWGVPDLQYFVGGRVQVFDRSGLRVFYTEDPEERWDGTFEGKEMPVGSYIWILESRETGEVRRGVLILLKN
jgi:gliding motility-associated-like protein